MDCAARLIANASSPGGFYNDDWLYLVASRYSGGLGAAVRALDFLSYRPLMTLYWPALFAVLGAEPTAHTAWTFAVASLAVAAVFVLLRSLGHARVHSAVVALLVAITGNDLRSCSGTRSIRS